MFKILIIDPNRPFRQSLKKVLVNRFSFAEIEEAADANEGLDKIATFYPHLVFLEIHLPAGSGLELARQIKTDHPDMVIVILTSDDLPEYQTAVEKAGIDHLVPKDDWTGEDMIALVESILSSLEIDGIGNPAPIGPQQDRA